MHYDIAFKERLRHMLWEGLEAFTVPNTKGRLFCRFPSKVLLVPRRNVCYNLSKRGPGTTNWKEAG